MLQGSRNCIYSGVRKHFQGAKLGRVKVVGPGIDGDFKRPMLQQGSQTVNMMVGFLSLAGF